MFLILFELNIWSPNSPDLNPPDYAVWGPYSSWYIARKFKTLSTV